MTAVAEPKAKKAKPSSVEKMVAIGNTEKVVAEVKAKTPAPKLGEPGFWEAEYPGEDVFIYTASDGTTVGLAAMSDKRRPKPGVLRKLRHQPPVEQMWFVIEQVASQAALEVSDEFDDKDYSQMFEEWSDWSNTSAGESSRSSAS